MTGEKVAYPTDAAVAVGELSGTGTAESINGWLMVTRPSAWLIWFLEHQPKSQTFPDLLAGLATCSPVDESEAGFFSCSLTLTPPVFSGGAVALLAPVVV